MSNKSHILQKRAARLFAAGESPEHIIGQLGIRMGTFLRWQEQATYRAELERHRAMLEERLSLHAMRLLERQASKYTLDKNDAMAAANLAKAIGMDRIFGKGEAQDPRHTAPKMRQTAPNMPETAPELPRMTPQMVEIFRQLRQKALKAHQEASE